MSYKSELESKRSLSPEQIRAAKCARTKQRNLARKEAMAGGMSRHDAVHMFDRRKS